MPIIVINIYKMTSKDLNQVKQNYDRLSGFYDILSGRAESVIFQRAVDLLRLKMIDRLLDIGCGTGKGLIEFKKNYPGKTLCFGVDISLKMCRRASQKQLETINSNALGLPIKASVFDAAIYSFSIEIIPEELINLALDECFRILKPGGVVCIICMADMPSKNFISRLYLWAHKRIPGMIDCRPISILHFLNEKRFMIIHKEIQRLYGLPVEILMAEKK